MNDQLKLDAAQCPLPGVEGPRSHRLPAKAARPTPIVHSLGESIRYWEQRQMWNEAAGAARILANVQAREKLR